MTSPSSESRLHDVKCPLCGDVLYRTGPIAPGVNGIDRESPEHQRDAEGRFVICVHCGRRVALEEVPSTVGVGLRVAQRQR